MMKRIQLFRQCSKRSVLIMEADLRTRIRFLLYDKIKKVVKAG